MDTVDLDGSGFHLFSKDSVSLSREEVEKVEEDEDIGYETEEAVIEEGEKDEVGGWVDA